MKTALMCVIITGAYYALQTQSSLTCSGNSQQCLLVQEDAAEFHASGSCHVSSLQTDLELSQTFWPNH